MCIKNKRTPLLHILIPLRLCSIFCQYHSCLAGRRRTFFPLRKLAWPFLLLLLQICSIFWYVLRSLSFFGGGLAAEQREKKGKSWRSIYRFLLPAASPSLTGLVRSQSAGFLASAAAAGAFHPLLSSKNETCETSSSLSSPESRARRGFCSQWLACLLNVCTHALCNRLKFLELSCHFSVLGPKEWRKSFNWPFPTVNLS